MTTEDVPVKNESQAAFVREYVAANPEASVDDVIEAGVQAGVRLSRASVHQEKWQIRQDPDRLEAFATAPAVEKPAKPKKKKAGGKRPGKGDFSVIDFVRARPTATPKELIQAARAEAVTLTVKQVQRAQFSIKMQNMQRPKRKDFIRRYPLDVPIAKVVADARKNGIKLFPHHVDEERALMRGAAPRAETATHPLPDAYQQVHRQHAPRAMVIASPTQPAMTLEESEALFRAIAFRLGYERVTVILADMLAAAR